MASIVNNTHQFQETSANMTVSVPSGTSDGDLMLACFVCRDLKPAIISGWTAAYRVDRSTTDWFALFYRVASSEPASYSWAWDIAQPVPKAAVNVITITDCNPTTILYGYSLTDTTPSITASGSGIIIGWWSSYFGVSVGYALDASLSLITSQVNLNGSSMSYITGYETVSPGPTGTRTSTTGSSSRNQASLIFVEDKKSSNTRRRRYAGGYGL